MKAVLFDVGGVLRDSRQLADESYRNAFSESGIEYTLSADDTWHLRGLEAFNRREAALRAMLCVMRSGGSLKAILDKENAESVILKIVSENTRAGDERIVKELYERSSAWFYGEHDNKKHKDILPAAKETLRMLSKTYALGAVSNSKRGLNVNWFHDNSIFEYFRVILGAEDMGEKKPSPEGLITACKKLSVKPEEAAYVGDSASDIVAAKRAGCRAIAVLWGMGTKRVLSRERPDAFAEKFSELPEILRKL